MPFNDTILNMIMAGDTGPATDALDAGHPDAFIQTIGAAVSRAVNAGTTTSSSTVTIGTGTKLFVSAAQRGWLAGTPVYIMEAGNPTTNVMIGNLAVDEDNLGNLEIDVLNALGAGTFANWIILSIFTIASPPATALPLAVAEGGTGVASKPAVRASFEVARRVTVATAGSTPVSLDATTPGTVFLVLTGATGAWAGHDNEWAIAGVSTWSFEAPGDGDMTFVHATGVTYTYKAQIPSEWRVIGADAVGQAPLWVYNDDTVMTAGQIKGWGMVVVVLEESVINLTIPNITAMGITGSSRADILIVTNATDHPVNIIATGGNTIGGEASLTLAVNASARLLPVDTITTVGWATL